MSTKTSADAPSETPRPIADDVFIVDAAPLRGAGMDLPLRMSVVRLSSGDVLLYSPTKFSPELKRRLEAIGPIRHLVAPSTGHWMFLKDWQSALPEAITWAVPGLRARGQVRRAGVRIDREVWEAAPPAWAADFEQVLVRGAWFKELALFHRKSGTLLLTDLVLNLEIDRIPAPLRLPLHLLGVTGPVGRAPAYVRALVQLGRPQTSRAAARLVALEPEQVVFSHGPWFVLDAAAKLRRSLRWLLEPPMKKPSAELALVGGGVALAVLALLTAGRRKKRR
jgi:hypothetical protein